MKTGCTINKKLVQAMIGQVLLSRDLIEAIRYYCFNNFTEFHRRHEKDLNMSYTTFSRALRGLKTTEDTIEVIEELAIDLGLYNNKTGGSDYIAYRVVRKEFCKKMNTVIKRFTAKSWAEIVEYFIEHRLKIIG